MNNTNPNKDKNETQTQANTSTTPAKAKAIKLGIDVHLNRYVVVRILDGGTPQPAQRFAPAEFLVWAAKQVTLAEKVFTCYEAGPFGYSLHRKLEKIGITNYVVRPRDWDEYGKKVKTDKRRRGQTAGQTGESSAVDGFRPGCAVASATDSAYWISEDDPWISVPSPSFALIGKDIS